MNKRPTMLGMHHVALNVVDLASCEKFYTDLLGFKVEWRPDDDNLYLTSGSDNLALHRTNTVNADGALDHLGIIVKQPEDVDCWHTFLSQHGVTIDVAPKSHRDGARSFYCRDPAGNQVQIIYHPPLSDS